METKHVITGILLLIGIWLTTGCGAKPSPALQRFVRDVAAAPTAPQQNAQGQVVLGQAPEGCQPGGNCFGQRPVPPEWTAGVNAVPYHEHALQNFRLGREYVAQGRYELARERYLLALAAASNDEMRTRLTQELDTVDRLILSQR